MGLILIVSEGSSTGPLPVTLELIAAARRVAADGDTVAVALAGAELAGMEQLPVDRVYVLEHPELGESDQGLFEVTAAALARLAVETGPSAVLFARSELSSVLAPKLAHALGAPVAQDCTGIGLDSGRIVVARPVFGGNAVARYRFTGDSAQVVVMRPGTIEPLAGESGSPDIVNFDIGDTIKERRTRLVRTVSEAAEGIRLEDADVVVSGGRGLGGPEPFAQLEELARLLGGAVGASRAACDAGWIDHSHQVGLTGKTVSPKVYITFGISGASQHMAGCSSARNIVAVNTDREANIFKEARFGVAGDWSRVLPAVIATLKDLA